MNHTSPIADCKICPRKNGHLVLKHLPTNHPNKRTKDGLSFNEEIACAVATR